VKIAKAVVVIASCMFQVVFLAQVRAGSPESVSFDQISNETNLDRKLELIASFEKQYPTSKILPKVYLLAVDVYRQKGDRDKIIEFGEKAIQLDGSNITAMMLLARNYAIESKKLDRALELAQRAVDSAAKLRGEPLPIGYSETQWKDYLRSNENAAGQILEYVKAIKARMESISKAPASNALNTQVTLSEGTNR
jgi:tetratricopeptide (TPR) repeat protein